MIISPKSDFTNNGISSRHMSILGRSSDGALVSMHTVKSDASQFILSNTFIVNENMEVVASRLLPDYNFQVNNGQVRHITEGFYFSQGRATVFSSMTVL